MKKKNETTDSSTAHSYKDGDCVKNGQGVIAVIEKVVFSFLRVKIVGTDQVDNWHHTNVVPADINEVSKAIIKIIK
jgi:hypothetical protein